MKRVITFAIAAVALSACKKTGDNQYEVQKPVVGLETDTVNMPSVNVSMQSTTVAVPKVEVKKESATVKVPKVTVTKKR